MVDVDKYQERKKKVLTLQMVSGPCGCVWMNALACGCIGVQMHGRADAWVCRCVGMQMHWREDALTCRCIGEQMRMNVKKKELTK